MDPVLALILPHSDVFRLRTVRCYFLRYFRLIVHVLVIVLTLAVPTDFHYDLHLMGGNLSI